ncbi:thioredoxin family protein [Actomonas aquatica]|uniref:Thioredoxin family protein n=1 Tax=Actomonas aquatica TaxID=2866162 RepID=A0ABZ1C8R8_9BACT|nr:thioredoxin family protein [Opitutus sp. WL0086]WRQ88092.1 thioredoxin family protein [Opitutus sp. WL0086]
MKSTLRSVLTATVFSAVLALPTFASQASVGEQAPDFTLTSIDGQTHRLSDFKGKTVVLEWVNPECPFVVKHYSSGNIPALQKSATDDGVVWLAINSGSPGAQGDYDPEKAAGWMESNEAAPTAYFRDQDGKVGRLYGAKTTPHMYVINPEGELVYNGAIDSIPSASKRDLAKAQNYVIAALAAVKNGHELERDQTQPYGCGVKY